MLSLTVGSSRRRQTNISGSGLVPYFALPNEGRSSPILPLGSERGAAQTITGLPVGFYVESGPAVVEGNLLRPTALPPRARFPVPVTLVAYQLGRIEGPAVRAAVPVRLTLHVRAPARAAFLAPAAAVGVQPQR